MPIYEYRCDACGAHRELLLKPGEEARPTCPACRRRMRRVISPTAFILKGSGWYVTDYPSSDRKKAMDAEGKPAAQAEEGKPEKTAKQPAPAGKAAAATEPPAAGERKRTAKKRG